MKRNLCRIGLAVILTLGLASAARAETRMLKYEGNVARMFSETLDPGGCINTWIDVYLFEIDYRTIPAPPVPSHVLIFFMSREDLCQSIPLNLVYGSVFLSDDDYSFNGMHGAHVGVSLQGSDFVTGATVPLTVDLTWEGQGGVDQARDRNRIISPDFKWIFHSRGLVRDAHATGSVVMGTEVLTPSPAAEASLSSNRQGDLYIYN